MKTLMVVVWSVIALETMAACSRERGEELLRMFERCPLGEVVTNNAECIKTVVDDDCEYRFCYSVCNGALRRVRVQRKDGGVDGYNYCGGKLDSASCSSSNLMSMVVTLFVGDGKCTNSVDRIEFDSVDGKVVGPLRILDIKGKSIDRQAVSQQMLIDKEFVPKTGSTAKIGPYVWTVIGGEDGRDVLLRDGKLLLKSDFALAGKYPWLVGSSVESVECASRKGLLEKGIRPINQDQVVLYYFIIDLRDDQIKYIPHDKEVEIERITGQNVKTYKFWNFWAYFLSKRGPERLAKLEQLLQAPVK